MGRGHLAALAAGLSTFVIMAMAVSADDAPAPIREFDIPTIEKLGQQMYKQDQEAWKATDILFAAHKQSELVEQGLGGWIVVKGSDGDVVRFIRNGKNGPERFYDIAFPMSGSPVLAEPQDKTLLPEELAQQKARRLAVADAGAKCTGRVNTIALRDPQGDGWLVWEIPATTDSSLVIMGGAIRYTISADGTTILHKDALAQSCGLIPRPKAPADGFSEAGLMWTHLVSLTPVETQVFAGLNYATDIFVETTDGKTWSLSKGHIQSVDMDSPGMGGYSARILAGHMEECRAIIKRSADEKYVTSDDAPRVILETETENVIHVPVPAGGSVAEVACKRLDIVPALNDYKVLRSGYALYIMDTGTGHPRRAATLEMVDGRILYYLADKDPPLTPEQKAKADARIEAFQKALAKTN